MFEEYFEKYRLCGAGKTARKQIKADKAAVIARIADEGSGIRRAAPKRAIRIAAICAAAACLTVTAGAAGGRNIGAVLRSWFGTSNENDISDKLSDIEVIDIRSSYDGLELKCLGSVTDDNFSTIFVEITRTDGGIFDCAEYIMKGNTEGAPADGLKNTPEFTIPCKRTASETETLGSGQTVINTIGEGVRSFIISDNDPLDNRITAAFCLSTGRLRKEAVNGEAELTLEIGRISRSIKSVKKYENEIFYLKSEVTDSFYGGADISVRLPLKPEEAVTVRPDMPVSMEITPVRAAPNEKLINKQHAFTLKSVSVTSSSLCFELEGEPVEGDDSYALYIWSELVKVSLKNGETIILNANKPFDNRFYNNGVRNIAEVRENKHVWYEKDMFMFGRLIDVNDIDHVEIGGQTVKF